MDNKKIMSIYDEITNTCTDEEIAKLQTHLNEHASNDKLEKMFDVQFSLQNKFGVWEKINDVKLRQQYINQMILACHEEVTEIMRETCYKNPDFVEFGWKKGQLENMENMKDEIIDLWHFIMNLSIVSGMDAEDFYNKYIEKNKENIERQKQGY